MSDSAPIPERVRDILTDRPTGFLSSIRSDGLISTTPVAVMFDGDVVRVSTVKSRVKYKNLTNDPRVTLCVPHRNNPNRYVEIRGRAEIRDDTDRSFIDSIARAYMERDTYPFDTEGEERVVIAIIAEQVSAPKILLAEDPPNRSDR